MTFTYQPNHSTAGFLLSILGTNQVEGEMKEGVQADWEAILRPTPALFIAEVKVMIMLAWLGLAWAEQDFRPMLRQRRPSFQPPLLLCA